MYLYCVNVNYHLLLWHARYLNARCIYNVNYKLQKE